MGKRMDVRDDIEDVWKLVRRLVSREVRTRTMLDPV